MTRMRFDFINFTQGTSVYISRPVPVLFTH